MVSAFPLHLLKSSCYKPSMGDSGQNFKRSSRKNCWLFESIRKYTYGSKPPTTLPKAGIITKRHLSDFTKTNLEPLKPHPEVVTSQKWTPKPR